MTRPTGAQNEWTATVPGDHGGGAAGTDTTTGPRSEFGHEVRRQRRASGLLLVEVAGRAGVSHSQLSRLEHGRARLRLGVALRITRAVALSSSAMAEYLLMLALTEIEPLTCDEIDCLNMVFGVRAMARAKARAALHDCEEKP